MWKIAFKGIAIANIETLTDYEKNTEVDQSIGLFVVNSLNKLPWYFGIPLKIFGLFIALLSSILSGKSLLNVSTAKRQGLLKTFKNIPLFGMFNKFVRAMAFMHFYDLKASKYPTA